MINIGSIQSFVALPNSAAYTTSKGGVRALTKARRSSLPLGVRVNAIAPGRRHRAQRQGAAEPRLHEEFRELYLPSGASAPQTTSPGWFSLASDLARYITGVTLPVDGGYLAY